MMKESRMFEGLTTCLKYCLEMGLDDEAQVIEAFIKTWDKMDYYGKKNIYSTMINLMRPHSMPRRPRSKLDEDLEDLKDLCYAAAKAQWDILGDFLLCHPKAGNNKMTLDYYQEQVYKATTAKIRKVVREELFKFERDAETGKLELIALDCDEDGYLKKGEEE
tara:strand:- start:297 stop:785 length:489 start_codon:yes stop_codon:yes gene_type:complete